MANNNPYTVHGVPLSSIRNRNEIRVAKFMQAALEALEKPELSDEAVMDAYAFALNMIPARYAQRGTIVLRDPVKNEDIVLAVNEALARVLSNPRDIRSLLENSAPGKARPATAKAAAKTPKPKKAK
jgi:Late competence development protein ComFB.